MENNNVLISGTVSSQMMKSHETHGELFYSFYVSVRRQSGTIDVIPILASEWIIDSTKDYVGEQVRIKGQYRSFNQATNGRPKLILSLFAMEIEYLGEFQEDVNEITLDGYVCKTPIFRETPLGRTITDLMLAVNRQCGKCDYIPCVVWGRQAMMASRKNIGDQVQITGRIQSRKYVKNEETRTAYEISVSEIS